MLIRSLCACLALTFTVPAAAQELDGVVRLEVLPGWTTRSGSQIVGLEITLAPGWKTYWRAPGDAGIPPMVSYAGSENIATARLDWPTPEVTYQNGMRSIGYHDRVILPVELTRTRAGEMRLAGTLSIGVCEEICVPAHLSFDAVLPEGGRRDPQIVAALVDRPLRADEAGVGAVECRIVPSDYGIGLEAVVEMPAIAGPEEMVIEAGDPQVWVSEPEVRREGGHLVASVSMAHVSGDGFALDRSAVRITILGRDVAVDIRGCAAG